MDTKERILQASFELFMNQGYHHTTMRQLVVATQLSKGAFYHYFKNKEDLYSQVVSQYFLSFYRQVDWKAYARRSLTLPQIEREMNGFYLDFVPKILAICPEGMSAYYVMYFEAYRLLPGFRSEVREFYANLEQVILNASENTFEPMKTATTMISKYEGILFLLAVYPDRDIGELLNRISGLDANP